MIKASTRRRLQDPLDPGEGSAQAALAGEPMIAAIISGRADSAVLAEVARQLLGFAAFLRANQSPDLARQLTRRAAGLLEEAEGERPSC